MKWSFASVGLIVLGMFGIIIIMLFNDITVSNEQDYYTLKDATEAAMIEAVDVAYYRLTGEIKISQEKFVENFTRRFSETSIFGQGNYDVAFYQIIEYPAKVSLRIYDDTGTYNIYTYTSDSETTQTRIVNELSAILDGSKVEPPAPLPTSTPTPSAPTPSGNKPTQGGGGNSTTYVQQSSGSGGYKVTLPDGSVSWVGSLKEANKVMTADNGLGTVEYYDGKGNSTVVGNGGGSTGGIYAPKTGTQVYPGSSSKSSSSSSSSSSKSSSSSSSSSSSKSSSSSSSSKKVSVVVKQSANKGKVLAR